MKQKLLNIFRLRAVMLVAMLCAGFTSAWGEKITDYSNIVSGKQYYIGATTGSTDYYLSVDGSSTSTSIAGTAVTTKANATAFTFAGSGTSWTIQFESGNYLSLKNGKDNGKVQVVENASTFTASNQSGKIRLTIGSYSVQKNNNGTQFGSYGNTQTDIWLEEVASATNYSITAQSNNNSYGTVSLSGTTITATPEDGYRVSTTTPYTVTSGSAAVTQEGNSFYVSASSDCTVTINFEEKPTVSGYTIDFENDLEDYVDWTFENVVTSNTAITAHGGSKYGANINASGNGVTTASVKTKEAIALPGTFTCYVSKATNNTTASTWKIQVSNDGETWTDVESKEAASMTKGTWEEFTADLSAYSNVYVQLLYDGSSAIRTVDDISITMRDANEKPTPLVTIDATGLTTTDLAGETNVSAGTISATVTHDEATISSPAVTWSSSETGVATIDANGAVTLIAAGTTTIKANFAGNDDYKAASKDYELTVIDSKAPGAENNPYTVAEAIAAIQALPNNNATTEHYYISGIVSAFYGEATGITSSSSKRYYISDDGTTTTQLLVYSGKGLNNAAFESDDDLLIGDRVTICGAIQNYQGNTPEIASGNYIVNRVTKADNDIAATGAISLSMANPETTADVNNYISCSSDGALSFESDNTSIVTVDANGIVTPIAAGTTTITVSQAATATYKAGSTSVTVTVAPATKADNEILLDETSGSTAYGTPLVVDYAVETGYDGTMTYTSNPDIADVSFSDDYITFTPKAVGEAVITISAPATAAFNAADDVTFTLTVTAPEGSTTAAAGGFVKVTSTADITDGQYLIVYEGEESSFAFDGSLETLDAASNTIAVTISEGKIAASDETKAAAFTIDVTNGTIKSASGLYIGKTANSNGLDTNESTAYTNTFSIDESGNAVITASGNCTLRYNSASGQERFRYYKSGQQAIQLYKLSEVNLTAKLSATTGYATYCSEYPLDFSDDSEFSAWEITNIEGTTITFNQITGSVKGGTGVFLKGENGATITLTSTDSQNTLDNNLLEGTLAPIAVAANQYYGLSGKTFVKVNAGTVPAGKALLPANKVEATGNTKALTFVFNSADGIKTVETVNVAEAEEIFNIAGQRLQKAQRGLNIIGGRKVVIK